MAAEQPTLRSGDRVLSTIQNTGLLMALAAPWIAGGVMYLQDHLRYVNLGGEAYVDTVKSVLAVYVPLIIARVHMARIRRVDEKQEEDDRVQGILSRNLLALQKEKSPTLQTPTE